MNIWKKKYYKKNMLCMLCMYVYLCICVFVYLYICNNNYALDDLLDLLDLTLTTSSKILS